MICFPPGVNLAPLGVNPASQECSSSSSSTCLWSGAVLWGNKGGGRGEGFHSTLLSDSPPNHFAGKNQAPSSIRCMVLKMVLESALGSWGTLGPRVPPCHTLSHPSHPVTPCSPPTHVSQMAKAETSPSGYAVIAETSRSGYAAIAETSPSGCAGIAETSPSGHAVIAATGPERLPSTLPYELPDP